MIYKTPPQIKLIFLEKNDKGIPFLTVERNKYQLKYPNGIVSEPVNLDIAKRKNLDAVVIFAWGIEKESFVYLRSCIRPAIYDREPEEGNQWELPAGLIEKGEEIQEAASRETFEELGFEISPSKFQNLGSYSYSAVGTIGERLHFVFVRIENNYIQKEPTCDGSPIERFGVAMKFYFSEISEMLENNLIKDMKTEIGIRRFLSFRLREANDDSCKF